MSNPPPVDRFDRMYTVEFFRQFLSTEEGRQAVAKKRAELAAARGDIKAHSIKVELFMRAQIAELDELISRIDSVLHEGLLL